MIRLKSKLKNVSSDRDAIKILKEEFENRGYPKTRRGAEKFQKDIERENPGVNRWTVTWNRDSGREIEDVIMDEYQIS